MVYNGFLADFVFNTCVMAVWCVFLWRVLDGPRFSWWGTALLTLGISAAYLVPVLTLTTAGSMQRLLLFPTGPLALAFVLFYGKRCASCLRSPWICSARSCWRCCFRP